MGKFSSCWLSRSRRERQATAGRIREHEVLRDQRGQTLNPGWWGVGGAGVAREAAALGASEGIKHLYRILICKESVKRETLYTEKAVHAKATELRDNIASLKSYVESSKWLKLKTVRKGRIETEEVDREQIITTLYN